MLCACERRHSAAECKSQPLIFEKHGVFEGLIHNVSICAVLERPEILGLPGATSGAGWMAGKGSTNNPSELASFIVKTYAWRMSPLPLGSGIEKCTLNLRKALSF